ncbi:MAG: hypothetical protein R6V40_02140 [Candidatus Moraniibacteriota bacterium]
MRQGLALHLLGAGGATLALKKFKTPAPRAKSGKGGEMFVKHFEEFQEGLYELWDCVGSVYQSLLENFSPSHKHYDYEGKEENFLSLCRQLQDKELAEEVIRLLVKNLEGWGGPFLASYGWRETHYQTTGGLVWGWSFHGEGCWEFFVRHPHEDPAPADSTLRETLVSRGWRG